MIRYIFEIEKDRTYMKKVKNTAKSKTYLNKHNIAKPKHT